MRTVLVIFGFLFAETLGLLEECTSNSDCNKGDNAICLQKQCRCGTLFYDNNGRCVQYVTEYKGYCQENFQCDQWLGINSECSNNRCMCKKNYRWYQGMCRSFVDKGEACAREDECYNGYDLQSLKCPTRGDKVCTCGDGYHDRTSDCRYTSKDGTCALHSDCTARKPICKLGKCTSSTAEGMLYVEEGENQTENSTWLKISENISCSRDDECGELKNSVCLDKVCTCLENHYISSDSSKECVRGFGPCSGDKDCANFSNSFCFRGSSCVCAPGFFYSKGACVAELGMPDPNVDISTNADCLIKPGKKLDKNTCVCLTYWFNTDDNRQCIKTTLEESWSCLENLWCRAMGPYAFCNSSNLCQCNSFAELNEELYCDKKPDVPVIPTDICLADNECKFYERCKEEKCVCADGFSNVTGSGRCLPNIGSSSLIESCDHIENAASVGGVCDCPENSVNDNSNRCLRYADQLGEKCELDEQCSNFAHAICTDSDTDTTPTTGEKRCGCAEGFKRIDQTCWKIREYGDMCWSKLDCTMVLDDSIECRKNICQCPIGKKYKNDVCSAGHKLEYSLVTAFVVTFMFIVGRC